MGRSPCCDKVGLKKGPWTPEEDQKLLAYIEEHGHGSWRALPAKAGLQRCGKSCRLRWTNYLRPDIKRGKFSLQEEQTIIQLHALLGNRWSAIATHLPKRTDNEIKNYWNTHLKKRLTKMGIDPVTHKPKNDALLSSDGQSKTAANLSHMAQWESARLEAEARLVRESKLRSNQNQLTSSSTSALPPPPLLNNNKSTKASSSSSSSSGALLLPPIPPRSSLDVVKAWNGGWLKTNEGGNSVNIATTNNGINGDLESPTSTLSFSENNATQIRVSGFGGENNNHNNNNNNNNNILPSSSTIMEFVGTSGSCVKEEGDHDHDHDQDHHQWKGYDDHDHDHDESSMAFASSGFHHELTMSMQGTWPSHHTSNGGDDDVDDANIVEEGFTNLLLNAAQSDDDNGRSMSEGEGGGESINNTNNNNNNGACDHHGGGTTNSGSDFYEDNKNYWNSILNLVNSSPSDSPIF